MFLGIEIGGTKLQLGVGRGNGSEFVAFERRNVDLQRGGEGIRAQIREVGRQLIADHPVERIGIGFGGPVVGSRGIVQTSHQVEGWTNFPLVEWCEKELGRPARLGNDCDCAALAEACFGAGRGKRTVFYVTVGTGIGGGFVIDRKIYGTDRPAAAEIGHLRPQRSDRVDRDVEQTSAGPGIEARFREILGGCLEENSHDEAAAAALQRCGGNLAAITAKQVAEEARTGNMLAKHILLWAADTLGWGVAQMITLLAPEIVVIGGGVSLIGEELFFQPVRAAVDRYVFEQLRNSAEIVPAQLGEGVVVHGALALAAS